LLLRGYLVAAKLEKTGCGNYMIKVYRNQQACSGLSSCGLCTECIQGLVDGVVMDTEDEYVLELLTCAIDICPVGAVTLERV